MNKTFKWVSDLAIVATRGITGVAITTLAALQLDPTFQATGHLSEKAKGALLVVAGMSLLNFLDRSLANLQKPSVPAGTPSDPLAVEAPPGKPVQTTEVNNANTTAN